MHASDNGLYARSFADVYDAWYGDLDDPAAVVGAVRRRCPAGATVVELGSGTGRLALPLHRAGFQMVAVDISRPMLAEGERGPLAIAADMTHVPLQSGCADMVLIAYNTLFNLTGRKPQQTCLAEASRLLSADASLAIEGFLSPTDARIEFGLSTRPHPTHAGSQLAIVSGPHPSEPDVIAGSHIEIGHVRTCRPWQLTYQSPEQLDANAHRAGLLLDERWSDWSGGAFDPHGERHVSWYKLR